MRRVDLFVPFQRLHPVVTKALVGIWNKQLLMKGMPFKRREEDMACLIADGLMNREIATKLGVAEHSVRNYLYGVFDKLGASTRVELIPDRNASVLNTFTFLSKAEKKLYE